MKRNKLFSALLALSVLCVTALIVWHYWPAQSDALTSEDATSDQHNSLIQLSSAKLAVAGIVSQRVTREDLPLTRTLPARFTYDDTRHVAIRAAAAGIFECVAVKPGDVVAAGETIAVLRCPAIGAARSRVLTRTAELALASTASERHHAIYQGVKKLADAISNHDPIESLEQRIRGATLGVYRSDLITKYSKALLAARMAQSATSVSESGAISGRVLQQRRSELQQAQAELVAALDRSIFESKQSQRKSFAMQAAAERSLEVARQELETLLGPNGQSDLITAAGLITAGNPGETDLARLEVNSPIAGSVERKVFSSTERVAAGDELFIVADTTSLWVQADIRERDWPAIKLKEGDEVHVSTLATDDKRLAATVYFVGRAVDPASGAIPLVAKINNSEGKYRPGLFARVEVPIGKLTNVLTTHDSAVVDLDGEQSVFVEEQGGYRAVAVETGQYADDKVEIRSGLMEGQRVVVGGAFVLKSELLLEGEE